MKNRILFLCGPTATGKTSLALHLASVFNGEIISCDSRQVYKHMDVVTGKDLGNNFQFRVSSFKEKNMEIGNFTLRLGGADTPSQDGVKIWGLDLIKPDQDFSVQHYLKFISKILPHIWQQHKIPIIVGGTGMYMKAIIDPPKTISAPADPELREVLSSKSVPELQKLLKEKNFKKFNQMNDSDRQNPRRLVRAIEVGMGIPNSKHAHLSKAEEPALEGISTSAASRHSPKKQEISPLERALHEVRRGVSTLWIGINFRDRQQLYDQIDKRVEDRLLDDRLADELNYLTTKNYLNCVPANTLGYQQLIQWMGGRVNFQDMVQKWKFAEHHYARRQLTWFKKQPGIYWFDPSDDNYKQKVADLVSSWYTDNDK